MNKKAIVLINCGIIILTALYITYYFHRPITIIMDYDSIIYDNDFERSTTVQLDGVIYKELFREYYFSGEITVDHDLKYKIRLQESGSIFTGVINTWGNDRTQRSIGVVITSKSMDKVWTSLKEINERYNREISYIVGPAKNKDEAKEILNQLIRSGPDLLE